jgi:hypothetical protein
MQWGRQVDYHNSRRYDRDEAKVGRFSLLLAWLGIAAKRKLRTLLDFAAPASSTTVLQERGHERHFTILGDGARQPLDRDDDCPFPKGRALPPVHDWRVLP